VTEAWTETIEHEATYKTVENPDYVPAWIEIIEHPAVECPPEIPEQPGPDNFTDRGAVMTCDGLFTWAELDEWDYSWNAEKQEWVPNEPVLIERVETKVRDLTREEQIEEGCIMLPPPPTETPEPPSEPDPEETEEPDPEET